MKRVLAMLLALSLVLLLFPVGALAAGANDIVKIAKAEVGTSGSPNKYTYWLGKIGGSYNYWWCAAFVSWCANQAGEAKAIPKSASVYYLSQGILNAGGKKVSSPQAGDIVVYRRKADNYYAHVGIMENGSTSIEGNYGNKVCRGIKPNTYDDTAGSSVANGKIEIIYLRPNYKGKSEGIKVNSYFDCDVKITTTKGKTVNAYTNIGDAKRFDYFDKGQTLYSTKGAKVSDGSTWYQVQAMQGSKVVTLWINAKTTGVKVTDLQVSNYNTILSVSPSTVNLNLAGKTSETVTLSWSGTYPGDGYIDTKLEGVAKAALVENSAKSGQAQMKISAEEAGTGKVTFRMNGRSTPGVFATATVNVTVTAPTYTISYNANGGSGAPGKQTKNYNKPLTLSSQKPTRVGYRFNGWATSEGASSADYQPGGAYHSNSDKTLYAVWAPASGVTYTVKHYLQDDSGLYLDASDTLTGTTGESVSPIPREYTGYSVPARKSATIRGDGSTVIEYTYIAEEYRVILRTDTGIDSVSGGGSYKYGDTVTINARVADGYTWTQWIGESNAAQGSVEQTYTFTMPDQDIVLTATATEIPEPDCSEGHTWGAWDIVREPTCEKDGLRQRSCEVCGETERESMDAIGHDWSRWDIVEEASCGQKGRKERVCQNCGETETETIAALEHDYRIDGETDTVIYYVCANCGDNYTEEKQPLSTNKGSFANFSPKNRYQSDLFGDVGVNDWFSGNVAVTYELGLMKGTGNGTFSPGNNVTLAETITLAARLHSIYHTGSDSFPSYDGGNWYDPYVDYARERGIVNTYYNYSRPATREEFVHILAKALPEEALKNITGRVSFADSGDITYMADVNLLSGAGVINGIKESGETYFKPLNTITRAEVAAVVGRMARPESRIIK